MTSPQPSKVVHPRIVTPGIETQNPLDQVPEGGMSCRPDWIRLVGSESMSTEVTWLLEQWFGEPTGTSHGAKYFKMGIDWHPGVLYSQGHSSKIVMVDLQGSRLACTPVESFMQLTVEIMRCGFHCTRIDLAVDHVGMNLDLHRHAHASCKAGKLCKIRTYADDSEFKADGTPQRYMLKLGKRESSVCARIYDKGLQTKTLNSGIWERLEVEFKEDRAQEVCMALFGTGERLPESLWRYVIGAFDFRIQNGRSELARRPREQWWADYIGQEVPMETKPIKIEASFATWWRWAQTSFGARFLQIAQIMEVSPEALLSDLLQDIDPAETQSPAIADLRARINANFRPIM